MQDRIYLLSIDDFLRGPECEALMRQALDKVDESRRGKVARIKQQKAKAAGLGAGLLLQLAVKNTLKAGTCVTSPDIHSNFTKYAVQDLLAQIELPISLEFTYGKSGKPYLKDYPFYFNLSHSGGFAVCAVSEREIGVDIQEHRAGNTERIAKRYFTADERKALDECEPVRRTQMFFDLWAVKEAYGKYTGDGIAESLEKEIPVNRVELQLIHNIPGYSLAVCKGVE